MYECGLKGNTSILGSDFLYGKRDRVILKNIIKLVLQLYLLIKVINFIDKKQIINFSIITLKILEKKFNYITQIQMFLYFNF